MPRRSTKSKKQTPSSPRSKSQPAKSHPNKSQKTDKKRAANNKHRKRFPDKTDEQIRLFLVEERKAKNRKSAQKSRDRKKKQIKFLDDKISQGLTHDYELRYYIQNDYTENEINEENNSFYDDGRYDDSQLRKVLHRHAILQAKKYDEEKNLNVNEKKQALVEEMLEERFQEMENNFGADNSSDNVIDFDDFRQTEDCQWVIEEYFADFINNIECAKQSKRKRQMELEDVECIETPPTKKQKLNENVETNCVLNEVNTNTNEPTVSSYDNQYFDYSCVSPTVSTTPTSMRCCTPIPYFQTQIPLPNFNDTNAYIHSVDNEPSYRPSESCYQCHNPSPFITESSAVTSQSYNINMNPTPIPPQWTPIPCYYNNYTSIPDDVAFGMCTDIICDDNSEFIGEEEWL
eukprot:485839_1